MLGELAPRHLSEALVRADFLRICFMRYRNRAMIHDLDALAGITTTGDWMATQCGAATGPHCRFGLQILLDQKQ